jgi:hypothetical protein
MKNAASPGRAPAGKEIPVKRQRLVVLKSVALTFLLPGLAGLIVCSMISVHYLDTMPRWPVPQELRTVPRGINGETVYQTAAEDRRLDLLQYLSAGVFLVGLVLSLTYLEKWGTRQLSTNEDEDLVTENYG